jgi:hypothetical protein
MSRDFKSSRNPWALSAVIEVVRCAFAITEATSYSHNTGTWAYWPTSNCSSTSSEYFVEEVSKHQRIVTESSRTNPVKPGLR